MLPKMTADGKRMVPLDVNKYKPKPYVQQRTQTAHIIVLCLCRWKKEHHQMGSSWGLTDIAIGYLSVEFIFVFLSPPSISLFLHACLLACHTLHLLLPSVSLNSPSTPLSYFPQHHTSRQPTNFPTAYQSDIYNSDLCFIRSGNFFLMR